MDVTNLQNNMLETLVDKLCIHVDTETALREMPQATPSARAFRKSLEIMSTLQVCVCMFG
jgi:hypothetical protein